MTNYTKSDTILVIVCPVCGKWKRFGKYKHMEITISKLCRFLAEKGINKIKFQYERCG